MNANVVEDDEKDRLEPESCIYLHAIVNPGSNGADLDVDVLSMKPLEDVDKPHPPGVASATGVVVGMHAGDLGKWVVVEGGEDDAIWTLA